MDNTNEVVEVYVPAPGSGLAAVVAKGSGVVALPTKDGRLRAYYEGNLYGAANVVTYADRVRLAWGRCNTRYPTTAVMLVHPEELVRVGTFDGCVGMVLVDNEGALAEWLGLEGKVPEAELRCT